MTDVNPPPQVRMPKKWAGDRDINTYLTHLNIVIRQLWQRTGGASDIIATSEGDFSFTTSVSSGSDDAQDEAFSFFTPSIEAVTFNPQIATTTYTAAPFDYVEAQTKTVYLPEYPNIKDAVIVASDYAKNVIVLGNGNPIKIDKEYNSVEISKRGSSLHFLFFGEYWRIV